MTVRKTIRVLGISLALLALYRDWPVLVTGSLVVVADHLLSGAFGSPSTADIFEVLERSGAKISGVL